MIELTDADLQETITLGEIPERIRGSKKRVAVVLTQSWCSQWMMMRRWLSSMKGDYDIYWATYEKMASYHSFMNFKETVFGNNQVPYIRFYIDQKLVGESNYCNQEFFLTNLGL
jgi:hypothetical protein